MESLEKLFQKQEAFSFSTSFLDHHIFLVHSHNHYCDSLNLSGSSIAFATYVMLLLG